MPKSDWPSAAPGFGGLEPEDSDYETARVVILPIPYEGTVSYGEGASGGPGAIIDASANMELYDEELGLDTYRVGIHTLPPVALAKSPEEMMTAIREAAMRPLKDGKFIAVLGGEHSVTKGILDALVETRGRDFGVLQLDAHADLRDSYNGTRNSHACIMRRVDDMDLAYSQVGIRSLSREEADFIAEKGRRVHYAHEIAGRRDWIEEVISELPDNVYITIDIDCLDPSIMPSTGTPEPGGLDWHAATNLLRRVAESKKIVGLDLVELAPIPGLHAPDFLAAKLLYRIMGYIFAANVIKGDI